MLLMGMSKEVINARGRIFSVQLSSKCLGLLCLVLFIFVHTVRVSREEVVEKQTRHLVTSWDAFSLFSNYAVALIFLDPTILLIHRKSLKYYQTRSLGALFCWDTFMGHCFLDTFFGTLFRKLFWKLFWELFWELLGTRILRRMSK